jgi:membrane protease YdiL (CAAX protease family)
VRLAAAFTLIGLLLALPGAFAFQSLLERLEDGDGLIGARELWGSLIGMTLLALGAVGFLVRRDVRGTLDRLGLRMPRPREWAVVVIGVAALYGLNVAAEAIQTRWFPGLAAYDDRVNQAVAGSLGAGSALLLGVSAGVGEEVAMRGALQPKLGLLLTSLLFAALHVQYSWVGIAVIVVFGLLLGAIRQRTCTTVSIAVHGIYDVLAVLSV